MEDEDGQPSPVTMMAALVKTSEVVQEMASTCPPTDEGIRRRCTYCEDKGQYTCNGCISARYCSRECQSKDWSVHRVLCGSSSEFTKTPRPSPNHVAAILFPAELATPRFIWLEQFSQRGYLFPIIDCWLQPYARHANMIADMNVLLEEAGHGTVGHGLAMIGIHEKPLPNVPVNASIMALGKPGQMKTWFGNQIIVGRRPNAAGTRGMTLDDVNFRDFRHAVDMYQHHPLNLCVINPERCMFPVVPGVIIHCDGALERFKRFGLHSRVERVVVRRDRARSSSARDTRILQGPCIGLTKLGLEWSYRQNPACQEWLEVDIKGQGLLNLPAKQMVYRIIRRSGRCCVHPVRNAGTIVVFDHLGSTIEPAQIQAINTYFQHISGSGEQSPADQVKNEIAERLCEQRPLGSATIQPSMEDFKDFWDRWQGNEETQGQAGGHPAISIQNECAST